MTEAELLLKLLLNRLLNPLKPIISVIVSGTVLGVNSVQACVGHPTFTQNFSDYRIINVWDEDPAFQQPKLNVVLDLDNTLVMNVPAASGAESIDLGSVLGRYELIHGTTEFLVALSRLPGVQISFFSAGQEQRNLLLINEMMDLVWAKHAVLILPKVYSRGHLFQFDPDDPGALSQFGKKDLSVLGSSIDLSRTILVDDSPRWIMPGQEYNWVGVHPAHPHMKTNRTNAFRAKNKLIPALGFIAFALEQATLLNVPPVESLRLLNPRNPFCPPPVVFSSNYLERGLREIRKVEPTFMLANDFGI